MYQCHHSREKSESSHSIHFGFFDICQMTSLKSLLHPACTKQRTKVKWLIVPAIVGGSALLADGIITPPISVASAVEGIRTYYPDINTIPIVIGILFFQITAKKTTS